jgi:site-specific DNA-methyltransferase (adenine-specific)
MGKIGRPRSYHPDRPATPAERRKRCDAKHKAELAALRKKDDQRAYHLSIDTEWGTRQATFDEYDREFHFTLDVCATPENAKCARFFTRDEDGLTQDWGREICWMNPPYDKRTMGLWMEKAFLSSLAGALVVCLVAARTDTHWWHDWVEGKASDVRRRKGRETFVKPDGTLAKHSAGFPSVAVIYRPWLV